jgi:hypothetical protein
MLIVDVSEVKLPGEAKQNNLPPECGQLIDGGESVGLQKLPTNFNDFFLREDFRLFLIFTQGSPHRLHARMGKLRYVYNF